jgi:hypothetical protein
MGNSANEFLLAPGPVPVGVEDEQLHDPDTPNKALLK